MKKRNISFSFMLSSLFIFILLLGFSSAADPGHGAGAVSSGTFESGNYVFPGNLTVNSTTNTLFVNPGNGRIGIGTASPTYALDVRGAGNFSSTIWINNGTDLSLYSYNQTLSLPFTNDSTQVRLSNGASQYVNISNTFFVNGTNGNVGIGTASPNQKLHVIGNVQLTPSTLSNILEINVVRNDAQRLWDLRSDISANLAITALNALTLDSVNAANLYFNNGGSTKMAIISSNVGIGTITPTQSLDVRGNVNVSNELYVQNGTAVSTWLYNQTSAVVTPFTNDSTQVRLSNGASQYVNISNTFFVNGTNGNVGIGVASSIAALGVRGQILYYDASTYRAGVGTADQNIVGGSSSDLGLQSYQKIQFATGGNTAVATIDASGNAGIGTATPTQKLDVRGNVNISNEIYVKNGTAVSTWLYNQSDGTGITSSQIPFTNSSSQIFITSGFPSLINLSNTLFINSTTGNLYNNGSSQNQKLNLHGDINLTDGASNIFVNGNPGLTIQNEQPNIALTILRADGRGHMQLGNNADLYSLIDSYGALELRTNAYGSSIAYFDTNGDVYIGGTGARTGTGKLTILNTGNIGIGTITPTQKLDVRGNINVSNEIYVKNGTAVSTWLYNQSDGTGITSSQIPFTNSSTQITKTDGFPNTLNFNNTFYVNGNNGRVGIGSYSGTSAQGILHVWGHPYSNNVTFIIEGANTQDVDYMQIRPQGGSYTNPLYRFDNTGDSIYTNNHGVAVKDTSGNKVKVVYLSSDNSTYIDAGPSGGVFLRPNSGGGTTYEFPTSGNPVFVGLTFNNGGQLKIKDAGGTARTFLQSSGNDHYIDSGAGDIIFRDNEGSSTNANVSAIGWIFNPSGSPSIDTRIYGDTDTSLIFADSSADFVGIGTATPTHKLNVVGTANVTGETVMQSNATITGYNSLVLNSSSTYITSNSTGCVIIKGHTSSLSIC